MCHIVFSSLKYFNCELEHIKNSRKCVSSENIHKLNVSLTATRSRIWTSCVPNKSTALVSSIVWSCMSVGMRWWMISHSKHSHESHLLLSCMDIHPIFHIVVCCWFSWLKNSQSDEQTNIICPSSFWWKMDFGCFLSPTRHFCDLQHMSPEDVFHTCDVHLPKNGLLSPELTAAVDAVIYFG